VYARGLNPRPAGKAGPGEINVPVPCAGVVVHAGDVVIADAEGVVFVPQEFAEQVLEASRAVGAKDKGRWSDLAQWDRDHHALFAGKLEEKGVRFG
jgi:4-hydroxy-4-methyl-2-oxoglutarate aldolase